MIHHLTDHNVDSFQFNGLTNSVLFYNHDHYTHFNYSSSASLKYVLRGQVKYHIDGEPVVLSSGNFLFVNSGAEVATTISEPCQGFSVFFDPGNQTGTKMGHFPILDSELQSSLKAIASTLETSHTDDDLRKLQMLVYYHVQNVNELMGRLTHKRSRTKHEILKKILIARQRINANLAHRLSIDVLAKEVMLSKHELIRQFKQVFGITPYRYFLQQMINRTKFDLRQGKTLGAIVQDYGLPDVFSYSKLFKKVTRQTPTQFRNEN